MGGPLALGTVAYGVTGAMLVFQRRKKRAMALAAIGGDSTDQPLAAGPLCSKEETARLAKDQHWFLAIFVVKVALGLVAFAFNPPWGCCSSPPTRCTSGARCAADPTPTRPGNATKAKAWRR